MAPLLMNFAGHGQTDIAVLNPRQGINIVHLHSPSPNLPDPIQSSHRLFIHFLHQLPKRFCLLIFCAFSDFIHTPWCFFSMQINFNLMLTYWLMVIQLDHYIKSNLRECRSTMYLHSFSKIPLVSSFSLFFLANFLQ